MQACVYGLRFSDGERYQGRAVTESEREAAMDSLLGGANPDLMTHLNSHLQDSDDSISFSHVLSF